MSHLASDLRGFVSAMNRLPLFAAAMVMAIAADATAQAPDNASLRNASNSASPGEGAPSTYPGEASAGRSESRAFPEESGDRQAAEEALRRAIWHSTEMLDARAYVLDYCERSARSSRGQGERYLQQVSTLSSAAMWDWLQRLQQKRAGLEGQRQTAEGARQWSVELAVQRLHEAQQAGFNAQRSKERLAEYWQQQIAAHPAMADDPQAQRAAAFAGQRLAVDPFAPTLDPASPPAIVRYAAAASLPGDLPRGDPANFSRGDGGDGSAGSGDAGGGPAGSSAAAAGAAPSIDAGGDAAAGP